MNVDLLVPVDAKRTDWPRKVAAATNWLLRRNVVEKDGVDIYPTTTASATYTQAEIQALMDAVHAISERLK